MSDSYGPHSFHKHNKSDIFFTSQNNSKLTQNANNQQPLKMSSIHFGDDTGESYVVKRQRTKSAYDPEKYYDKSSACERKLKEFYPNNNISVSNSKSTTHGTLTNEMYNNSKRSENCEREITAKERKYRQYFNSKGDEEIQNFIEESRKSQEPNVKFYDVSKTSKDNKIDSLKSNIFNDSDKVKVYQNFPKSIIEEKPFPKTEVKPILEHNPWIAKIDWKDPKNEILFHKDYVKEGEESSPLRRKLKEMQDHFEGATINDKMVKNFEPNSKDEDIQEINCDRNEIKESLRESMTELNDLKLKKTLELSSVQQGKEFYRDIKVNRKKNRPVSCYEIKNIKDYDVVEVKTIENMFKNKGIHIFDVKSNGAFINGNNNGNLSFKVREKENFENDLSLLQNEIKSKMGLELKHKDNTVIRSPYFKINFNRAPSLPINVKWDDPHLTLLSKGKREIYLKTNYENELKPPVYEKEKLSKAALKVNTQYKNLKGVIKKK